RASPPARGASSSRAASGFFADGAVAKSTIPPVIAAPPMTMAAVEMVAAVRASLRSETPVSLQKFGSVGEQLCLESLFLLRARTPNPAPTMTPATPAPPTARPAMRWGPQKGAAGAGAGAGDASGVLGASWRAGTRTVVTPGFGSMVIVVVHGCFPAAL